MLSPPQARGPLRIAEVGAGTGIATRLLLEGAHSHGGLARMHAFDPSTGMLHHLQQSLFGTPDGPGLVEKLKLEGKLASDAQVLVGDGEHPLVLVGVRTHPHGAAPGAVPDGVVEEVVHRPGDLLGIDLHDDRLSGGAGRCDRDRP